MARNSQSLRFLPQLYMTTLKLVPVWALLCLVSSCEALTPTNQSTHHPAPSVSSPTTPSASSFIGRVKDSLSNKERSREELKLGIAAFYDKSTKIWEDVWGEHLHHGYYVPADRTDHQQAQIDMVDEALIWANCDKATKMVDVGCGIGGSSRHIARKFGCTTEGVTLSSYQANRANTLSKKQGLGDQCNFQVADALDMPFEDNSFDLVWSMESGEHMPDKQRFMDELFRVAMPGGRIVIVTWCHRDLEPGETSLTKKEIKLLKAINRAYYLPEWCSVQDYVDILESKGM